MRRGRLLVLCVIALGCDWFSTSHKLAGSDCKPRKLSKLEACAGEDRSFQECYFYWRASGVADHAWCEALSGAQPSGGELSRCTWDTPSGFTQVACDTFNIHGKARCFACKDGHREAALTYVFAYDEGCARSIEQVSCNADPVQAAAKLGPAQLN